MKYSGAKKTDKYEHYATRFTAKKVFLKALGTGWETGTAFNEKITNDKNRKPDIILLGKTTDSVAEMKIGRIFVSLSYLKTLASAFVIIENP